MDLFPTLLEEYDLRKAPGLDNFKKHIKEQGKTSGHSLAVNGVSSHGGWDPLEDKSCVDIMNVFHQCIDDYNFKIGNYPSMISGAFYCQLPEGDFGQFFVVSPLKPYMMCIHNVQPTRYGVYEMDIPIKQDHLYLFPSWLEHGSRVNNTDGERITVSFNTTPVPKDALPSDFKKFYYGNNEDS